MQNNCEIFVKIKREKDNSFSGSIYVTVPGVGMSGWGGQIDSALEVVNKIKSLMTKTSKPILV